MRRVASLIGSCALLLLAGCRGGVSIPQSPLLKYVERKSGLIVLAGTDGNLSVMDQGGGGARALTSDGKEAADGETEPSGPFVSYSSPVWSPDGSRVAAIRTSGSGRTVDSVSIVAIPAGGGDAVTLFASSSQAPTKLDWSPDSARIVFLASSVSGSSYGFYIVKADGGEALLMDAGVPYGWSWSPRGQEIVIHAGSVAGGLASDRLAFLDVTDDVLEEGLGLTAGLFESPSWSHDGRRVAVATWADGRNRLFVTNRKRTEGAVLSTLDGPVSLEFSPSGDRVAYIVGTNEEGGAFSRLYVVPVPSRLASQEPTESGSTEPGASGDAAGAASAPAGKLLSGDDVVAAFFWSPDGSRIAYFVPRLVTFEPASGESQAGGESEAGSPAEPQQAIAFTLKLADPRTAAVREAVTFLPTPAFLGLVQEFSRLGQSQKIWSPDSRNLVYSGIDAEGPGIMVALAGESIEPRRIAGGLEAYWSWK